MALARAIYSDADVICLDDVLSAVDAHTARFIWEKCFTQGFLKLKKTVILVSHQIQYLSRPEVNSVVILREGRIWLQGSWGELARSGDAFLNLVEEWEEMEEEDAGEKAESKESKEKPREHQRSVDSQVGLHECQSAVASVLGALEGRRINGSLIQSVRRSLAGEAELEADLVREGTISWTDFRVYLEAFGSSTVICIMLLLMVFSAVSQIASTLWLAAWTSNRDSDQEKNVLVYFFISVSTSLANCAQAILLTVCALAASRTIHQKMLQKILAAPMSFFDASPTGRVLNRFLQDLQNIDSFVPNSISDQIVKTLNIVTQLSLVYIEAPWVLCTLPVLAVPYSMIYKRMRIPNRDSRRLESAARSPVYTHFNDTLHGRETLRAFGAEDGHGRERERAREREIWRLVRHRGSGGVKASPAFRRPLDPGALRAGESAAHRRDVAGALWEPGGFKVGPGAHDAVGLCAVLCICLCVCGAGPERADACWPCGFGTFVFCSAAKGHDGLHDARLKFLKWPNVVLRMVAPPLLLKGRCNGRWLDVAEDGRGRCGDKICLCGASGRVCATRG